MMQSQHYNLQLPVYRLKGMDKVEEVGRLLTRNCTVWPIFFLINVFLANKGLRHFTFICYHPADAVLCGGPKISPYIIDSAYYIFTFGPLRSMMGF